jgi:hypothetical protein
MATFMLLLWLLENLLNYTWQIRNKLKDLSRTFIDIEKLVDTFEEIPKYKDDSNLPDFNYKN